MRQPTFLVLSGDGINCERETDLACKTSGAKTMVVHINELLQRPNLLREVQGVAFPGGFSFGDELGSGQALSLKIRHFLNDELREFVHRKGAIIGICNGLQILARLGLLPDYKNEREVTLAPNDHGTFLNKWAGLKVNKNSVCKWTTLLEDEIELPVRHAEGRVILAPEKRDAIYERLLANGQIPFTYTEDINGSDFQIAGLCDPSGMILGMMPHPEAALFKATSRLPQQDKLGHSTGYYLFKSMVEYLQKA